MQSEQRKVGRPPLGEEKRTARIALTLTATEMSALKQKCGAMPLAIALRDHCEKTGFFLENKSGEVENCYADHPKLEEAKQPFTVRWKNPSDWFQQHMKKG